MHREAAGISLPALNYHVAVRRIQFEPEADAANSMRRDKRGAGAQEGIEHEIAAL